MKPNRRMLVMIVALAGTLAAVAWVNGSEDDIAAPVARERGGEAGAERGTAKAKSDAPELDLAGLDARDFNDMAADLFKAKSWYVPPPPPPPPTPTAPPPPFTYLGRMIQGDHAAVFVANGGRNQAVRVGDVIDQVWRIDAIDATQMKLTYLPLNEAKTLELGAAP